MKPFYLLLPELPSPPKKLIDAVDLDQSSFPTTSPFHEVRIRFCHRQGQQFLASPSVRARLPDSLQAELEQWVRDNIIENFLHVGINYRHCNSDTSGIHTDSSREFSLTYNITTGGSTCGVTWWQEKGYPLVRDLGVQVLDFDTVEPMATLTGPSQQWFLHDARILHSTEGIETPRIQIQISLNHLHLPDHWRL
jgi:hypothetical protein